MGPFPHDAPPAKIDAQNPAGTDGFEFVEFAHPRPDELAKLFARMGYTPVARHKTKNITVYRQGDINYILNAEPSAFASRFVADHGPCAASMAWRVVDAKHAFEHAVKLGGEPYVGSDKTLAVPAIKGLGGSLLYFVDRYGAKGSWSCKNALAEVLTLASLGAVAGCSDFLELCGFFVLESRPIGILAVPGCSATADGRISAAAMPSSPPRAGGRP